MFTSLYIATCSLMGASIILFLQGILNVFLVFNSGFLLYCSITGLVSCLLVAFLIYPFIFYKLENIFLISVPLSVFWFLMILSTTWLYCRRVVTLGHSLKVDGVIKAIPFIFIIIEIPTAVAIVFDSSSYENHHIYLNVSLWFTVIAIFLESFLYAVLLKKLYPLMNKPNDSLIILIQNTRIALVLLILAKFIIIIAKLLQSQIDMSLRPFITLMRLNIVLQFYGRRLEKLNVKFQAKLVRRIRRSGNKEMNVSSRDSILDEVILI
eukprot:NODE_618_length_5937_cov_0.118191.p3 type:complete len:266 gc:universal NODE_618_length_5937_cov_0.118191:198-995(+)